MSRCRQRMRCADFALLLVLLIPPLLTIETGARRTHFASAAALNLLFVLCLLPEVLQRVRYSITGAASLAWTLIGLLLPLAWQFGQGPVWDVPRLWWYASFPLFWCGLLVWFQHRGEPGLLSIVLLKVLILMIAICWACSRSLLAHLGAIDAVPFGPTPIYRHVRAMNDEMPWALMFGTLLLIRSSGFARFMCLISLGIMGYFSAWAGSRAQMLAIGVLAVILVVQRGVWSHRSTLALSIAAIALGGLLAVLIGEGDRLFGMLGRTVADHGDMTSGRLLLWLASAEAAATSAGSLFFGIGPDAFARLALDAQHADVTQRVLHPHNLLVLWLLEFGVIGLATGLYILWANLRRALSALTVKSNFGAREAVAAIVCAQLTLAMFSGIGYFVIPTTFLLVLFAFLASARTVAVARGGERSP